MFKFFKKNLFIAITFFFIIVYYYRIFQFDYIHDDHHAFVEYLFSNPYTFFEIIKKAFEFHSPFIRIIHYSILDIVNYAFNINLVNYLLIIINFVIIAYFLKKKNFSNLIIIIFLLSFFFNPLNFQVFTWSFAGISYQITFLFFIIAVYMMQSLSKNFEYKRLFAFIFFLFCAALSFRYILCSIFSLGLISFLFFNDKKKLILINLAVFFAVTIIIYDHLSHFSDLPSAHKGNRLNIMLNWENFKLLIFKIFYLALQTPGQILIAYLDMYEHDNINRSIIINLYFLFSFVLVAFIIYEFFKSKNKEILAYFLIYLVGISITALDIESEYFFKSEINNIYLAHRHYFIPSFFLYLSFFTAIKGYKKIVKLYLLIFIVSFFINYNFKERFFVNYSLKSDLNLKLINLFINKIEKNKFQYIVLSPNIKPGDIHPIYLILRAIVLKNNNYKTKGTKLYYNYEFFDLRHGGIPVDASGVFVYGNYKFIYYDNDKELNQDKIRKLKKKYRDLKIIYFDLNSLK